MIILKNNYLLFIYLLLQNYYFLLCYSKCVMYDVCNNQKQLLKYSNPLESKWYNCYANRQSQTINSKLDFTDAISLKNKHEIDLYKKVCPMLYKSDNDKLCCSYNQLLILQNDLQKAETIIGSCPSCFLNFRTMWCYLTCADNQADHVVANSIKNATYYSFTQQYHVHKQHLNDWDKEDQHDNNKNDTAHNNTNESNDSNNNNDDYNNENMPEDYQNETDEITTPLNNNNEKIVELTVVTDISFYLTENFVENLIRSCRDVKLYSNDALQSICSVSSKHCKPADLIDYLGLKVEHRPIDIRFILTKNDSDIVLQDRNIIIKPANPKSIGCNESYSFGDFESNLRCSCKVINY